LYALGQDRPYSAYDDVSEDSELERDDGEDGEPGDLPESKDEEEVVPLEEHESFSADMFKFSTEQVEPANVVSLRML